MKKRRNKYRAVSHQDSICDPKESDILVAGGPVGGEEVAGFHCLKRGLCCGNETGRLQVRAGRGR